MKMNKVVKAMVLAVVISPLFFGCGARIKPNTSQTSTVENKKSSDLNDPNYNGQSDNQSVSTASQPKPSGTPKASIITRPTAISSPEESKTRDNYFTNYGVNPFISTNTDHLSTFGIDVDTASYTWMRKSLLNNILPSKDSVRVEEYVNFFDYNYPKPEQGKFTINTEMAKSNLDKDVTILRVGLQGKEIKAENRKDALLTFVIDVSGSMNQENRLGLVKQTLSVLVNELRTTDKVAIVIFGTNARTILESTSDKDRILKAIDTLQSEGATNTEAGLRLGYQVAEKAFKGGAINRVILCSDGVANTGDTSADSLLTKIKQESESGVTLSTVGFGMGNYNDVLMEQLADKGDGNYAYVDNLKEAQRIFEQNLTSTLQVIAKDVKVQVDFNPEIVNSYRLIGYENRDIADKDFRNDKVDSGEVGSNHSVTALYQLKLNNDSNSSKIANIYLRYKDIDNLNSLLEMNKSVDSKDIKDNFNDSSDSFKLAVAVADYAEILRDSNFDKNVTLNNVFNLANELKKKTESEKVVEFANLVQMSMAIKNIQK
jgi:Ca-activated chloride channel family protein